jgi:hypothetical protein
MLNNSLFLLEQVAQSEKTFKEIMQYYRRQPQAQSHIYRSVLCAKRRQGSGSSSNGTSNTSSPVPSDTDAKGEISCSETECHRQMDGIRAS